MHRGLAPVLLPCTEDVIQYSTDQNLEPQFIRLRHNNEALFYADTADRNPDGSNNTDIFNPLAKFQFPNNIIGQNIKRLTADKVHYNWGIPNVNARNNQLAFTLTLIGPPPGTTRTAVVAEGYYTLATFAVALQNALNAAAASAPPTGVTFIVTANSNGTLTITATSLFFFPADEFTSTMLHRGYSLITIPREQVATLAKVTGLFLGYYTRWVSFFCKELTQDDKNPPSDSAQGGKITMLFRVYLSDPLFDPTRYQVGRMFSYHVTPRWINVNREQNFETLNFRLEDEYNQPLYTPPELSGSIYNGDFTFTTIFER